MFMPIKTALLEKRINLLKAQRHQEYQAAINEANTEYGRCNMEVSKASAEWLDMDEMTFGASMKDAMMNKDIAKQMRKNDENLRIIMEPKSKEPLSKEKAKEILMERMKMEFNSEKKLKDLKVTSQQHAQQIIVLEKTKVMD